MAPATTVLAVYWRVARPRHKTLNYMAQPLTKRTVMIPREQNKYGFDILRVTADYRVPELGDLCTGSYPPLPAASETLAKSNMGYQYEPEIWRPGRSGIAPFSLYETKSVDPCVEKDGRIVLCGDDGLYHRAKSRSSVD
jgi:hypothetical protein